HPVDETLQIFQHLGMLGGNLGKAKAAFVVLGSIARLAPHQINVSHLWVMQRGHGLAGLLLAQVRNRALGVMAELSEDRAERPGSRNPAGRRGLVGYSFVRI